MDEAVLGALDSRQLVAEVLTILRKALRPYVQRELKMRYGARWWANGVEPSLKDMERLDVRKSGGTEKEWMHSLDTHKLLRVIVDQWREVFHQKLDPAGRAYVAELIDVRNRWAHEKPFSVAETYRAINTMTLLLREVAPEHAEGAVRLEQEVLRRLTEGVRPSTVAPPVRRVPRPEPTRAKFWLKVLGGGGEPLRDDWMEYENGLLERKVMYPRRPSVVRGDRIVYYAAGWRRIFAEGEASSEPYREQSQQHARFPWWVNVHLGLVRTFIREGVLLDSISVDGRNLAMAVRQAMHIRLRSREYESTVRALGGS